MLTSDRVDIEQQIPFTYYVRIDNVKGRLLITFFSPTKILHAHAVYLTDETKHYHRTDHQIRILLIIYRIPNTVFYIRQHHIHIFTVLCMTCNDEKKSIFCCTHIFFFLTKSDCDHCICCKHIKEVCILESVIRSRTKQSCINESNDKNIYFARVFL